MFSWKKFGRKNPRLSEFDYSEPGIYSITLVTQDRECCFGDVVGVDFYVDPSKTENACVVLSDTGQMVKEYWEMLPNKFSNIRLDAFIVMPNHVHGIIEITADDKSHSLDGPTQRSAPTEYIPTIPNMMQWFKSVTTNEFIRRHITNRKTFNRRLWQRKYYDHIARDNDDLDRIREYIRNNPKEWYRDRNNPKKTKKRP